MSNASFKPTLFNQPKPYLSTVFFLLHIATSPSLASNYTVSISQASLSGVDFILSAPNPKTVILTIIILQLGDKTPHTSIKIKNFEQFQDDEFLEYTFPPSIITIMTLEFTKNEDRTNFIKKFFIENCEFSLIKNKKEFFNFLTKNFDPKLKKSEKNKFTFLSGKGPKISNLKEQTVDANFKTSEERERYGHAYFKLNIKKGENGKDSELISFAFKGIVGSAHSECYLTDFDSVVEYTDWLGVERDKKESMWVLYVVLGVIGACIVVGGLVAGFIFLKLKGHKNKKFNKVKKK